MAAKRNTGAWRFSYRVVMPVVLAVVVGVGAVGGFVFWSTAKSDDRALQRETHLVSRVIDQQVANLTTQQDYYSNWDEAITALQKGDMDWIDTNLGSELYSNDHFDRVYVLNPGVRAIYAMYEGGKTTASHFEADRAVVAPMVASLKSVDAGGALAAYDNGNNTKVPNVAGIAEIDGRPAYVGVTAIMSESGDDGLEQKPGSENFLVAVRFLDGALGKDLSDQYLIDSPSFSQHPSTDANTANYPLKNLAGDVVGWFSWHPDRPGAQILAETLPAMLGAFAIAGVLIALLLRGLRRSTAALEAGRVKAEYDANHDVLTGLANRAWFNHRLDEALGGSADDGTSIALMALDLDRFKQVNDTLGHEAGDQLLREVGARLQPLVGVEDTVARVGGDEFAIIRHGVRNPDEIASLSSRIIAALGAPFVLAGRVAQIGVSIGVVVTPASKAARDLSSKADIALYAAKASGRNQYKIFEDGMKQAADYRETVGAEMAAAHLPVDLSKVA